MLAPNRSQVIPPIALPHISRGSGNGYGRYVQSFIDHQVNKAVLDAALHNPTALYNQQIHPYKGIFGGTKGSEAE